MRKSEAKSNFDQVLNSLAYSKGIKEVFTDLIDCILYRIIFHDECNLKKNPAENYSVEDQGKLRELMILLGEIMENDGEGLEDGLGDLFMEHLSFGRNGQYFTPQPISDMIAKMTLDSSEVKAGMSVNDCACGSGRMLLGAAKIERNLRFFGSDIDLTCVKMAVINLAMNNLVGEIVWGNPLTMDHYASFQIGRDFLTNFPTIAIRKEEHSVSFLKSVHVQKAAEEKKNTQTVSVSPQQEAVQLTLF